MMKGEKLVYSDAGRWIRDVVIELYPGEEEDFAQGRGKDRGGDLRMRVYVNDHAGRFAAEG